MGMTAEQIEIIEHDPKRHARVLAVAGSGKTTTLVHRIKHLIEIEKEVPQGIRAVMYNKSAQLDFTKKLKAAGVASVKVQTFHAMGWGVLEWAAKQRFTPRRILIDKERDVLELVKEAIIRLQKARGVNLRRMLDAEEAMTAISTWKAMVTSPDEAKHLLNPAFVEVYREFEVQRAEKNLCTFDDQIYDAVRLLEKDENVRSKLENKLDHLIIDEFQDINYARFRLASLLAGERARLMIVGDDDQCIYEWQGSRSSFIKRDFEIHFSNHPHTSYKLTRSFRFGPVIAQIASNVIFQNTDRVEKELVAADLKKPSQINISVSEDGGSSGGGNHQAVPLIEHLRAEGVHPENMVVLVRKYSQSYLIQSFLLAKKIPFRVPDEQPLIKAFPVRLAMAYLKVAECLDKKIDAQSSTSLQELINRPNRYVKVDAFKKYLKDAESSELSVAEALRSSELMTKLGVNDRAAERLIELEGQIRAALRLKNDDPTVGQTETSDKINAGRVLAHLMNSIPFKDVFREYRGESATEDDLSMMGALAVLLREAAVGLGSVKVFLKNLDSTQGETPEKCITITTLFKAKGLEWDHVLLPDLVEGQCPDLRVVVNACVNREDSSRNFEPTETLESERRLFYVAVTRAREAVYMFADATDRALLSRFIHEAFIKQTVASVEALQVSLKSNRMSDGSVKKIISGAKSYGHLRNGLLTMLRLASEGGEASRAAQPALAKLAYKINSVRSAPFSYPRAYPDPEVPRRRDTLEDRETGLPF